MWSCKHCNHQFELLTVSDRANHSRWCDKNPSRSDTANLREAQATLNEKRLGALKTFQVDCFACHNKFFVKEREKKFPIKEKYFCSRSCANSLGGKAKAEKYHSDSVANYTTIAWRHHEHKCCVCGEEKIVAVHHLDENHSNNDPRNLVPLCPTHHQYMHSRYKSDIKEVVDRYIKDKWAVSVVGGTRALQA